RAKSAPIPTFCEPWPGKRKASLIGQASPSFIRRELRRPFGFHGESRSIRTFFGRGRDTIPRPGILDDRVVVVTRPRRRAEPFRLRVRLTTSRREAVIL